MGSRLNTITSYVWFAVLIPALLFTEGCTRVLHRPQLGADLLSMAELWQEPADLESRDLFNGPGGPELAPRPVTYTFVARKNTGTNPGYDVRDPEGRLWSVKLGKESQSEVAASRILWAIGFHQPPNYYVERWTLAGPDPPQQPAGRFRPELAGHEVTGEWSWYDNPFIGTRPFAALVTTNLLLANWDLKTANNKIYEITNDRGTKERRYVVRDLGGSLGKAKQPRLFSWFSFLRYKQGSRNNLEDFESQGFIKGVSGDKVTFDYRGIDKPLIESITPSDLRWTGQLLSRLSEGQLNDAFRAAGYTDDQSSRYVRELRERITQLMRVESWEARRVRPLELPPGQAVVTCWIRKSNPQKSAGDEEVMDPSQHRGRSGPASTDVYTVLNGLQGMRCDNLPGWGSVSSISGQNARCEGDGRLPGLPPSCTRGKHSPKNLPNDGAVPSFLTIVTARHSFIKKIDGLATA